MLLHETQRANAVLVATLKASSMRRRSEGAKGIGKKTRKVVLPPTQRKTTSLASDVRSNTSWAYSSGMSDDDGMDEARVEQRFEPRGDVFCLPVALRKLMQQHDTLTFP